MICQVSLWCSHKVNITMNTTHMPHILTLKIRAIAPTNHLYGNIILTSAEIFSNVKLADIVCSFCITHFIAIHINVSSRVDTIKVEKDTLILPACRQREITTIRAHRVLQTSLHTNVRLLIFKRIVYIHIHWQTITIHL